MGESQGPAGETVGTEQEPTPEQERTPEQVRHEIEQTRSELGDTVAELAAKTDVKAHAHRAVDNAKAQTHLAVNNAKATGRDHQRSLVLGAVAVLAVGLLIRRSRRR